MHSFDVSGIPGIALSWLATANDATEGILDILMAILVSAPMLVYVWRYLQRGAGGGSGEVK
jgi:hypothetical protein